MSYLVAPLTVKYDWPKIPPYKTVNQTSDMIWLTENVWYSIFSLCEDRKCFWSWFVSVCRDLAVSATLTERTAPISCKCVCVCEREREREQNRPIRSIWGETPWILMEEQGLLGDWVHQPIKEHPAMAGYHGNQPPETMSAVITLATPSSWSFSTFIFFYCHSRVNTLTRCSRVCLCVGEC